MTDRFEAAILHSSVVDDGDPGHVLVALSDPTESRSLILQRGLDVGGCEDWGVYVEIDQQSYAGYDRAASCTMTRSAIRVDLAKPFDGPYGPVDAVEVVFAADARPTAQFAEHLRMIFAGREDALRIIDDRPNG